jgi:hypothetical protein
MSNEGRPDKQGVLSLACVSFHPTTSSHAVFQRKVTEHLSKHGWRLARHKDTFLLTSPWGNMATPGGLARNIHNTSAAIANSPLRQAWTRLARRPGRRARHSVGQHTVSSMPPSFAAPRACLAWRLRDFATNRHE